MNVERPLANPFGVGRWMLSVERLLFFCSALVLMSSVPFEMTVSVLPEDIDEQNHVNNTVYLRWVQEVATAHWKALASAEAQAAVGWIVLRHEIDYKLPASLGDEILLSTWVGAGSRLKFERFTEIRRKACPEP